MPQKGQTRADCVPAAPIAKALREWLEENDLSPSGNNMNVERYYSPYDILSERTGLKPASLYAHAVRCRHPYMQFDVADMLLCAIERPELWHRDPVLSEVYESACKGADRISPCVEVA